MAPTDQDDHGVATRPHAKAVSLDGPGLIRFLAAAGFRTHRSANACWYEAGPRFLSSVPSHHPISLPPEERRRILTETRMAGLRYTTDAREGGRASSQTVAEGEDYSLARLSPNARSKIRRGLRRVEVRRISGAELVRCGEPAVVETLQRQGRYGRSSLEAWCRLLRAIDAEPAVEIWSAWYRSELAAYLIVTLIDDICELGQGRSRNHLLRHYPNDALIYAVTEDMLVRRGIRAVTFGLDSLVPIPSLDRFKLSLGFHQRPIYQNVVFHPVLRAALSVPMLRSVVRQRAMRDDTSIIWRKAYGLMRLAGLENDP